jgi:hypothetical protein
MSQNTTRLALPFIIASQAQKHITHNEALRLLDGIVQLSVLDKDTISPPGSPVDGSAYIVPANAAGAWSGWDGDVAFRADGAWLRLGAAEGWRAYVADEGAVYLRTATGWEPMLRAQQVHGGQCTVPDRPRWARSRRALRKHDARDPPSRCYQLSPVESAASPGQFFVQESIGPAEACAGHSGEILRRHNHSRMERI